MRVETLLYPGVIANGLRLRTESAKAISYAELYMPQASKDQLAAFFGDCAYKTGGSYTPTLPGTQAIVSNGGALPVKNSAGATVQASATAAVSGNTVTGVSLPATQAVLSNGSTVGVKNSVGATVDAGATAAVSAGVLTGVNLVATKAVLTNADANIQVQNSAGAVISSACVAAIGSGVLSNIKLPATVAAVANGTKYNAVSVTGSGNFATFTVSAGVITAIVLSAS
jgi:hypothetical protein